MFIFELIFKNCSSCTQFNVLFQSLRSLYFFYTLAVIIFFTHLFGQMWKTTTYFRSVVTCSIFILSTVASSTRLPQPLLNWNHIALIERLVHVILIVALEEQERACFRFVIISKVTVFNHFILFGLKIQSYRIQLDTYYHFICW